MARHTNSPPRRRAFSAPDSFTGSEAMIVRPARALGVLLLASVLAGTGLAAAPAPVAPRVPPTGALAVYREGHLSLAAGEFERAQALFEGLPEGFVLADYAAYYAAESLVRAGADAPALERFRALPDRFPDSVLAPAAILAA